MEIRPAAVVTVAEVEAAYGFPPDTDGVGQCVALLEFGGRYRRTELKQYFSSLGVAVPKITDVFVDGATNAPASERKIQHFFDIVEGKRVLPKSSSSLRLIEDAQCTVETTMDIELVGALAPKAHRVIYFAPPTEQGIYLALARAVHSKHGKKSVRPSVISISRGSMNYRRVGNPSPPNCWIQTPPSGPGT